MKALFLATIFLFSTAFTITEISLGDALPSPRANESVQTHLKLDGIELFFVGVDEANIRLVASFVNGVDRPFVVMMPTSEKKIALLFDLAEPWDKIDEILVAETADDALSIIRYRAPMERSPKHIGLLHASHVQ